MIGQLFDFLAFVIDKATQRSPLQRRIQRLRIRASYLEERYRRNGKEKLLDRAVALRNMADDLEWKTHDDQP